MLLLWAQIRFLVHKNAPTRARRGRTQRGPVAPAAPAKPCASALTTTSVNECFLSPQMSQRKLLEATEARVNA